WSLGTTTAIDAGIPLLRVTIHQRDAQTCASQVDRQLIPCLARTDDYAVEALMACMHARHGCPPAPPIMATGGCRLAAADKESETTPASATYPIDFQGFS